MEFVNGAALGTLALLVPLVILYFVKPKPRDEAIPSLMFFIRETRETRLKSFFKRFVRDPLMLLQVLILAALALSLAGPFFFQKTSAGSENIVIIIDGSASMQANDVQPSRFEKAVQLAGNAISDRDTVSIILAESVPIVVMESSEGAEARKLLPVLKPKATPTNLRDAVMLARDILAGKSSRKILLYSDMAVQTPLELLSAVRVAQAEGTSVDMINVGGDGENLGIVDIKKIKDGYSVVIENFIGHDVDASMHAEKDGSTLISDVRIVKAFDRATFTVYNLSAGITSVNVDYEDNLPLDNKAYILIPEPKIPRVLVISENESEYLELVLSSLSIEVTEARPPVFPSITNFDVVVLDELNEDSLLPGTVKDIGDFVDGGGGLVIVASPGLDALTALEPLMPVQITGVGDKTGVEVVSVAEVTRDVDFEGVTTKYFKANAKNNTYVLAVAKEDGSPMVAYALQNKGKISYVGIQPRKEWSDFVFRTSFPILWSQLIDFSVTQEEMKHNFKTGDFLPIKTKTEVKTPSTTVSTDRLLIDETGAYIVGQEKIVANLLDEKESDLRKSLIQEAKASEYEVQPIMVEVKRDLAYPLLFTALVLAISEVMLIRYRREL